MEISVATTEVSGPTAAADRVISPELVLVTPELREQALVLLPAQPWSVAEPSALEPHADAAPRRRSLTRRVELTFQVPFLLLLVVGCVIAFARVVLLLGGPVVAATAIVTLLDS